MVALDTTFHRVYKLHPAQTNNTCALKVSIALNMVGVVIPSIVTSTNTDGTKNYGTIKGKNGLYYFLNAASLNRYLKIIFGTNDVNNFNSNYSHLSPSQCDNLSDRRILISIVTGTVSGHADLYDGSNCSTQHCLYVGPFYFFSV